MSVVPREKAGAGAAGNNTVRQVGGALGVAILGSVLAAVLRRGLGPAVDVLPAGPAPGRGRVDRRHARGGRRGRAAGRSAAAGRERRLRARDARDRAVRGAGGAARLRGGRAVPAGPPGSGGSVETGQREVPAAWTVPAPRPPSRPRRAPGPGRSAASGSGASGSAVGPGAAGSGADPVQARRSGEHAAPVRGRPRSAAAEQAIRDAAAELLSERGIGGLSMEAVAARAGVARTAVYRRWPTPEDLRVARGQRRSRAQARRGEPGESAARRPAAPPLRETARTIDRARPVDGD